MAIFFHVEANHCEPPKSALEVFNAPGRQESHDSVGEKCDMCELLRPHGAGPRNQAVHVQWRIQQQRNAVRIWILYKFFIEVLVGGAILIELTVAAVHATTLSIIEWLNLE